MISGIGTFKLKGANSAADDEEHNRGFLFLVQVQMYKLVRGEEEKKGKIWKKKDSFQLLEEINVIYKHLHNTQRKQVNKITVVNFFYLFFFFFMKFKKGKCKRNFQFKKTFLKFFRNKSNLFLKIRQNLLIHF